MITAWHNAGFEAPLGKHIMPIRKFALVAAEIRKENIAQVFSPEPVTEEMLRAVHTEEYIRAVRTGEPRALAESQKFPWSPQLYPSVLLTNGAVVAAARAALKDGVSAAVASGFHHSHQTQGEGFCTFNGLVVASEVLRAEGLATRIAVLDMDLHYGNGTAFLATSRPWLRQLSIYGNDYLDNQAYRDLSIPRHSDGPNHHSIPLPAGTDWTKLEKIMKNGIPRFLDEAKPDILLYQAGADYFREDPYSPLDLDHDALFNRDRLVFQLARERRVPIAWTLAGGYTENTSQVVQVHVNTFRAAREVFDL
ncbi:MAG TPA: histone deacetylase [Chthoniobacterales bacterium]